MKTRIQTFFLILLLSAFAAAQSNERVDFILKALNSKPENWLSPIKAEDVEMGTHEGRIVVNKKSKFTYFLHIADSSNPKSEMVLVPMSTSRYTPTYYQTDEWWDANKDAIDQAKREGKPMPKQNMDEVQVWLEEMKLTTNPDVFIIKPDSRQTVQTQKLQDYLLEVQLQHFVENGKVILYRGAEKPNELDSWKSGKTPRGVRYWTPTANYAWRYGRKNREFLDLLLKGETPLFRFEVPVEDFKQMNQRRWPKLTFGTELTKNAHHIFDQFRYFGDHFYPGQAFLGWGDMGVEIEIRSNRSGAGEMTRYYKRPATIEDLVNDRIKVLLKAQKRLKKQVPSKASHYENLYQSRIDLVKLEGDILSALKNGQPELEILAMVAKLPNATAELAYIDGINFPNWVRKKASNNTVLCKEVFK